MKKIPLKVGTRLYDKFGKNKGFATVDQVFGNGSPLEFLIIRDSGHSDWYSREEVWLNFQPPKAA